MRKSIIKLTTIFLLTTTLITPTQAQLQSPPTTSPNQIQTTTNQISTQEFLEKTLKTANPNLDPNSPTQNNFFQTSKNLNYIPASKQPTDPISREEALIAAIKIFGIPTPFNPNSTRTSVYLDTPLTSPNLPYFQAAKKHNLTPENNPRRFNPTKNLTHIEATKLLQKFQSFRLNPEFSQLQFDLINHPKFQDFLKIYNSISKDYLREQTITTTTLIEGAIQGMIDSIKDPYSNYQTKETIDQQLSNDIEGIGIYLKKTENSLFIEEIVKNSPADQSGLKIGDQILKVNKISIDKHTINEAINNIKGPANTTVTITVLRNNSTLEFKITRAKINVSSVRFKSINNEINYISISRFASNTSKEFNEAMVNHQLSNKRKLILDLRENLGGYLYIAQEILNNFFKQGTIIFQTQDNHENIENYISAGPGSLSNNQIIVLINENTASAAEVIAAAFQDHQTAKLLGTKSYGKGSIQKIDELNSQFSLKLSIAYWLTPFGKNIDGKGLIPEIQQSLNIKDLSKGIDSQLEKAIEILNS